jgi:predicted protein tyrosine phosphatase
MIYVCSLSRLEETLAMAGADRVISLLAANTMFTRPSRIRAENHLLLSMHDIIDVQPDMTPPGAEHVERLFDFARSWDRQRPLVVHCYAGISRSTAAAYIISAMLAPHRDEHELARALRTASPSATPNQRLIAIADELLRRDGRMTAAIAAIGRGSEAFEGTPFAFPIDVQPGDFDAPRTAATGQRR